MANMIQFDGMPEIFEIHDAEGVHGGLFHLATLEFEQFTYLALGAVRENEFGKEGGIVIVRQIIEEDGTKKYAVVHEEEELKEVVPRFIEAVLPDADIRLAGLDLNTEDLFDREDLPDALVFDYSDNEDLVQ